MWKRDESVKPAQPTSPNATASTPESSAVRAETTRQQERDMQNEPHQVRFIDTIHVHRTDDDLRIRF